MAKPKKKKLEPTPRIRRRLFRLWSEAVRERDGHACAYCGIERGTLNKNAKKIKCDAHHYLSRDVRESPLKFDIRNGISLCPEHHKFSGLLSAHKAPITFYEWVRKARPEHYRFVLDHTEIRVDLENRLVLDEIERCLREKTHLDIDKLLEIEQQNPRKSRTPDVEMNPLFGESEDSTECDHNSDKPNDIPS